MCIITATTATPITAGIIGIITIGDPWCAAITDRLPTKTAARAIMPAITGSPAIVAARGLTTIGTAGGTVGAERATIGSAPALMVRARAWRRLRSIGAIGARGELMVGSTGVPRIAASQHRTRGVRLVTRQHAGTKPVPVLPQVRIEIVSAQPMTAGAVVAALPAETRIDVALTKHCGASRMMRPG